MGRKINLRGDGKKKGKSDSLEPRQGLQYKVGLVSRTIIPNTSAGREGCKQWDKPTGDPGRISGNETFTTLEDTLPYCRGLRVALGWEFSRDP